jgi:NAD(P)-dependent dehydrogenase (short-subunit alcohol dehydrogenase family)
MAVWLVTGTARRFGAEVVRQAAARGHQVVATARRPERIAASSGEVFPVALDVTDERQARDAVAQAVARFGRIDVVVNSAALALVGAVEEASADEVRDCFDTNVFGLLHVVRAVLPVMRRQRSGLIVNISAVGGFVSNAAWGVYSSTKFAMEGLSDAMREELAPLGVKVTVVEPGFFHADLADPSSPHRSASIEDYAESVREAWAAYERAPTVDPVKAAAAIVDLAEAPEPPTRLQLGSDCVAKVEAKLALVRDELNAWRPVSLAADAPR